MAPSLKLQALAFAIKDLSCVDALRLWTLVSDNEDVVTLHKIPGVGDAIIVALHNQTKEQRRRDGKNFQVSVENDDEYENNIIVNIYFKSVRDAYFWLYTNCATHNGNLYFDVKQKGLPALGKEFKIFQTFEDEQGFAKERWCAYGTFVKTECGQGIKPEITKKNKDIDPKTFVGLN